MWIDSQNLCFGEAVHWLVGSLIAYLSLSQLVQEDWVLVRVDIFKMASVLKSNGCKDIENLIELCGVPQQKILIDENGSLSKVCLFELFLFYKKSFKRNSDFKAF